MSAPLAARRFGRVRRVVFAGAELTFRVLGGRRRYRRRHLADGRFVIREEAVPVADLAPSLEGFRIVQLSDVHAGPFLGPGDLSAVADAVEGLAPDVVALTGDFVAHRWEEALLVRDELARCTGGRATLGVFGNHDYKGRLEANIVEAYESFGARFLRNECIRVEVGQAAVAFVGVEDLEEGRVVDYVGARAEVRQGDVEVVLSHNPRGAAVFAAQGARLVLAGHSHGTQIDLPVLRHLGPQHPGLRLELGPTTVITSRGLGVIAVPWRVGAPAEIVVATLVRAPT